MSYVEALRLPAVKNEFQREVRTVLNDSDRRSRNVVISGLAIDNDRDDCELVTELFEQEFSMKPVLSTQSCKRVGKMSNTGPRRLLVNLRSSSTADELLKNAKKLRSSSDSYIAGSVFINKDLNPDEAKLAYELRVRRRAERQASSSNQASQLSTSSRQTASGTTSGVNSAPPGVPTDSSGTHQPAVALTASAPAFIPLNSTSTQQGASVTTSTQQGASVATSTQQAASVSTSTQPGASATSSQPASSQRSSVIQQ